MAKLSKNWYNLNMGKYEEVVFKNLGIKIVNHDTFWRVYNLSDQLQSFTFVMYSPIDWLDRLRTWNEVGCATYQETSRRILDLCVQ